MQDKEKTTGNAAVAGSVNGSEKKLSREQRRQVKRTTEEAMIRFNKFCTVFADWMYDTPDLTGKLVDDKIKELDAKWQVYCKSVNMNLSGVGALKDYCSNLYAAYKEELNKQG